MTPSRNEIYELLSKFGFPNNINPVSLDQLAVALVEFSNVQPPPYLRDVYRPLLMAMMLKSASMAATGYANGLNDGYQKGFQHGLATAIDFPGERDAQEDKKEDPAKG